MREVLWRYRKAICQTTHRRSWRFYFGQLLVGLFLYMDSPHHRARPVAP